jgi:anti-anti-sigma factor
MYILAETKDGVLRLYIEGELTIYTAVECKAQLQPYLTQSVELEVDLSEVSEVDSAGLQLLILLKHETSRVGGNLRLVRHSRRVIEAFELCDLASYFSSPLVFSKTSTN